MDPHTDRPSRERVAKASAEVIHHLDVAIEGYVRLGWIDMAQEIAMVKARVLKRNRNLTRN